MITRAERGPEQVRDSRQDIRIDERLRERRTEGAAPAASALGPGSQLGNYLIVKQIGEGGMGVVYKAQDTVLDRTVALKILPPHLAENRDFMHRFRTEAYAQARLQHANIVTLYSMLEVPEYTEITIYLVIADVLRLDLDK